MASKAISPVELARALETAGVVDDLDSIARIVIDIDPRDLVKVYVQRIAGPELKQVAGLLGEMMRDGRAENPDADRSGEPALIDEETASVLKVLGWTPPKRVRYHVLVSQDLLDADTPWAEAGLRLIEQGGFLEPGSRWCLFEDGSAPEEMQGRRVELTLTRGRRNPGDLVDTTWVSERRVVA